MNRDNFITLAVGYATKSFVRRWLHQSGKNEQDEFGEADLEDVFHAFERAKYLEDEGAFHERHPLPTTKRYGEGKQ